MKAALIPPVANLDDFCGGDDFYLVLSHLLKTPRYLEFFRYQRLRGAFLVLDNGAHENTSGEGMQDLLTKALKIQASEIVLPDTLFDHRATVRGAEDAFGYLLGHGQDVWKKAYPSFMLVPQGKTPTEWGRCFTDLIEAYVHAQVARPDLFPYPPTIGISKDYELFEGGLKSILAWVGQFREWMSFDVHLLGWGRHLAALWDIAREFTWVRSTDSAKPFVYALAGVELGLADYPEYPGRPARYFEEILTRDQCVIALHNVKVFRKAADAPRR